MNGVKINNIVKRSISLSPTVNTWAEVMAKARGKETNFSAFLAELIYEARQREKESPPPCKINSASDVSPENSKPMKRDLVSEISRISEKPANSSGRSRKPKVLPPRPVHFEKDPQTKHPASGDAS